MKKMIKKNRFFIYIALIISFLCVQYFNLKKDSVKAETQISAKALCVIDSNSKRKLYNKNENQKLAMASTTKIVTALTVLNNCNDLDKEFTIDNRAVGITGTSIYLKKDEVMTVRELLYGMMLPSGNDAAMALAYYVSKDIPSFCALMQKTANQAGAYNSSFTNPHGLDDSNHYTTAYDLALITSKALENETFYEIVNTKSTRIRGSSVGTYRYLKNKNKLLNTLNGCIGVKTGYTGNAGRCFVGACERDNFRVISVVLNCGPMFEETAEYINQSYTEYQNVKLLNGHKILKSIYVENGKQDYVKIYTKKEFIYPLTKEEQDRISYKYNIPNMLKAPVKKDEIIGNLEIYLDKHLLFSEKIYTISSIKEIGVWSSFKDITSNW